MHCASCAVNIEHGLKKEKGVIDINVNFASEKASLTFDSRKIDIVKIKEIIDSGYLGDMIYYDSIRVNLGLFQQDVDVIWDLAPHDISIMDHLMPFKKLAVSATGCHYYQNGVMPKAVLTVYMENDTVAHINVSWVSPVKIRQTLIGGTSKMILYDDNQPSEKIKIYDKGVELYETKEEMYQLLLKLKSELNITALHISHSKSEAVKLADKVLVLEEGVVKVKTPDSSRL